MKVRVLLHSKRGAAILLGISERTLHTLIMRRELKVISADSCIPRS
jgi:hypothetical protein